MKRSLSLSFALTFTAFASPVLAAGYQLHTFEKVQLSDEFYAEGANFGDLNNDGTMDIASGPFWYEGPDFGTRHEIYPPKAFDPRNYSDCFLVFVHDLDDNGWDDLFVIGFPGAAAYWYENPGNEDRHWERHLAYESVGNESPVLGDLDGDGSPELIFNTENDLGYAKPNPDDPTAPWTFTSVSPGEGWSRYTHGLGYGDLNGDGRADIIAEHGWWKQPESLDGNPHWAFHPVEIGPGAQMYAYDVDGDDDNDIVSSLHAHGWGLAWFRHEKGDDGAINFSRQAFTGDQYRDSKYGVRFSQPHSLALVDMDGDGLKDLISGKRFWAHGPDGDAEPNAPSVIYWFKTVRDEDGSIDFLPFEIDDQSGVGTQVVAGDVSGDGHPDIVVANKNGLFLFLNTLTEINEEEWQEAQPKLIPFHRK